MAKSEVALEVLVYGAERCAFQSIALSAGRSSEPVDPSLTSEQVFRIRSGRELFAGRRRRTYGNRVAQSPTRLHV